MAKSKSKIRRIFSNAAHLVLWPLIIVLILCYISPYVHPEKAWWLSFFGLGYPILLIFSLITLSLFALMHSKRFYVLLIILVIGFPIHVRYLSFYGSNFDASNGIHLMSYNVRLFNYYEWLDESDGVMTDKILAHCETNQPAILCLQEYLIDNKKPRFQMTEKILKAGGFTDYRESFLISRKNRNIGVATFSKYPIIRSGGVSDETEKRQFAFYTDIVINADTLRVYNIHLQSIKISSDDYDLFSSNEGEMDANANRIKRIVRQLKQAYPARVAQAEAILNHASESPYPIVICGDYNDPPVSYVYQLFNSQYTDAFRGNKFGIGSTYAGKLPAGRIDYIFHDKMLTSSGFKIQKEALSDHYSIETVLNFERK
jgi:endonuclease/exonuclease/phosphatase family metal-dependent hydrolase